MPYINTIDINGVVYTLENLTDGNNIVALPELSRDDIFVLRGNIIDNTSSTSTIQPLSARQGKLLRDDLNSEIQNRINDVNLEEERATEAERVLTENLNKEIEDRIADVDAEETRATNAEKTLTTNLNAEIERAQQAESEELARAQAAEKVLTDNLAKEVEDRISDVDAEEERAQAAEKVLTDNLSAEIERATNREEDIDAALSKEVERATGAEKTLTDNLAAEIERATGAEGKNAQAISDEYDRAVDVESSLASRIETMETFFKEADIDASKDFIDTLKEIQSYIASDKTGAAAMAASIQGNTDSIAGEQERAEGVEETLQDGLDTLSQNLEGLGQTVGGIQQAIENTFNPLAANAVTIQEQDFDDVAKAQARKNIGACDDGVVITEVGDTLTWDGRTEGRTTVDFFDAFNQPMQYVHVSDVVLTLADIPDGEITGTQVLWSVTTGWSTVKEELHTSRHPGIFESPYGEFVSVSDAAVGIEVYQSISDNKEVQITFPKAGIYFLFSSDTGDGLRSLTIPGYTGFIARKISPELLTDVANKRYVDGLVDDIDGRISTIVGTFVEPIDCIVERGTSGSWTYRKWNSGIAECWGTVTGTLAPSEAESGLTGLRVFSGSVAFPTGLFVDIPSVTYNCRIGDGYSFPADAETSTITHFNWTALSTVGTGYSECAITAKAYGVWK